MFDRKAHWQKVYREESSLDVSWYQSEPGLSLELIRQTGITQDEPIIDVGGGASVLVDYLQQAGFVHLSVLDICAKALAKSKARLGAFGDNVDWIEADITEFSSPYTYCLWHDRAVFHFLTDELDKQKYVKALKQGLKPGGHLIIAAFDLGGPKQCSGLDVVQYDATKLTAELGEDFELVDEKREVHITPADKEQKFAYFRFIRKANG